MKRLVVVGNGMAGMACVEQILKYAPSLDDARDAPSASRGAMFRITVFGDETHVNYNRILLSSVLAGEKSADDIVLNSLEWYEQNSIQLRLGVRITSVDPARKTVTGDDGSATSFDKLLLATGSNPLIPPIEGTNHPENAKGRATRGDPQTCLDGRGRRRVVLPPPQGSRRTQADRAD